jgi:signal transduction histidine kinase
VVEDDGPGMPAAERARAVEPFWRHPAHRGADGTGLGLAIVDALARASGGRLHLNTAHPHGLLAIVRLPAASGPVEPATIK